MDKFEFRCDLCGCYDECKSHSPTTCGKNLATITCGMAGCDKKIRYPIGIPHPRYCKVHEKEMTRRHAVGQHSHRKLDSYETSAEGTT